MTDIKWPEGSTHKIDYGFAKWVWVNGAEYNLDHGEWVKNHNSWSLDEFKESDNFKIIERPIEAVQIKWPEGAEAKINGHYTKWVDGNEYNLKHGEWVKSCNSWSLDKFKESDDFEVIERPIEAVQIKWPEGAEVKIDGYYTKWVDGNEYNLEDGEWVKSYTSWSLDEYHKSDDFEVIERPIEPPYMPEVGEWCETVSAVARYFYVGVNKDGGHLFENASGVYIPIGSLEGFRPVKTERDKFIEKARESDGGSYSMAAIFGSLYDSGARFK
jgi:hypothetical protein